MLNITACSSASPTENDFTTNQPILSQGPADGAPLVPVGGDNQEALSIGICGKADGDTSFGWEQAVCGQGRIVL